MLRSAWFPSRNSTVPHGVPKAVRPGDNVPVIHWLHGSAYAFDSTSYQCNGFDGFYPEAGGSLYLRG